ncbi:MAG TPA: hypothetical protein VE077_18955 [Candidatus Methylomirabilis sp.]|nr:hypothetical protein [Candidatus Methylomirabilis sp.]
MKLNLRSLSLVVALALTSGIALAHGNQKHVVGTVEKVSADAVTVKTPDGKSVEVKLVAATTYVVVGTDKVAKPAKLSDLHVGDRVVIHATPKGETLEAAEVRFSAAAGAAAGSKL